MDISKIKAQSAVDLLTGIISAVMFILINVCHWFLAYSFKILVISGSLFLLFLLTKLVIKKPWGKRFSRCGLVFCGVMLLLSSAGTLYSSLQKKTADEKTSLCDFTDAALDNLLTGLPWMSIDRLQDNTIRFYAGEWGDVSLNELCKRYTIQLPDTMTISPIAPLPSVIKANSRAKLVAFDTRWARQGFEDEYLKPLSPSVNFTVAGLLLMNKNEWDNAFRVLNEAFCQGNGVAGYYLYFAYANGLGVDKDTDESMNYLKESADLGYRRAQQEYGQILLAREGDVDNAMGLQYLQKATLLSDFSYYSTLTYLHRAIDDLQDYYHGTKQYEKAYSFTKNLIKESGIEDLTYQYHLDNCILSGRYSEALDIIQKGQKSEDFQNAGYCKVVQAKMLSEGLGVKKDFRKAEIALRFASDSLDYPFARKKLAELYSQEGYEDEAAFWQRLYDIRFHSTINE